LRTILKDVFFFVGYLGGRVFSCKTFSVDLLNTSFNIVGLQMRSHVSLCGLTVVGGAI